MQELLGAIVSYVLGLASNFTAEALLQARERRLRVLLDEETALRRALGGSRSLADELRGACAALARDLQLLELSPTEQALRPMLTDDIFQADLLEWLAAGGIEEGEAVRARLLAAIKRTLHRVGAPEEQLAYIENRFFEAVEAAVYSNRALADWRHRMSLDYLRAQVAELRRRADEAAGIFTIDKQEAALARYCEKSLAAWDIIDLSNLPEGDIQLATQRLLLRQLYMPLRVRFEQKAEDSWLTVSDAEATVAGLRFPSHRVVDPVGVSASSSAAGTRVGEQLRESRRLLVLGDPGGGKTTMLRWMATAYLLRHTRDAALDGIPDVASLPQEPWIPVLIRCRDLGEADLCRCFTDFLTQHLSKTELLPEEVAIMRAVVLNRIAKGEALVLVDGLDEISNPGTRAMFCQELERTAARYPVAPIVATSRVVGYRDMPHRVGTGFSVGVIAELTRAEKDDFATRWVEITEQHQAEPERAKRAKELVDALHSSDRIERLTGNPMLLTTLALVKRKVGTLPNRRTKLYAEAVSVLLNWNPRLYQVIEEDEAIPQLEYIAFEMCRRGVQRIEEEDLLNVLDRVRNEYPHVRAMRRRAPHEFIALLEARSSILIRSGSIWSRGGPQTMAVWEFRHLTFQEYLAARALLDGRYPGRDRTRSLAEQVAPLAGAVTARGRSSARRVSREDVEVPESWREVLRLLVADCKDDDVDEVIRAIATPLPEEDAGRTGRARAALAALSLADEPNVSESVARSVLKEFCDRLGDEDGSGGETTPPDEAACAVALSAWWQALRGALAVEFHNRVAAHRSSVGGTLGMAAMRRLTQAGVHGDGLCEHIVRELGSQEPVEVTAAALTAMVAAFEGKMVGMDSATGKQLASVLLEVVGKGDAPGAHAAAWALGWLSQRSPRLRAESSAWTPGSAELDALLEALQRDWVAESETCRWLAEALAHSSDARVQPTLISLLEHGMASVRAVAAEALRKRGGPDALSALVEALDDSDARVRRHALDAVKSVAGPDAVPTLMAKLGHSDEAVRSELAEKLGKLGDARAVEALREHAADSSSQVRLEVVIALLRLGDVESVREQVASIMGAGPTAPCLELIRAIEDVGTRGLTAELSAALGSPSDRIRLAAAAALIALQDQRGADALTKWLRASEEETRRRAVRELARVRGSEVERVLVSSDMDNLGPWLDPVEPITAARVARAAKVLGTTVEDARAKYEAIRAVYRLVLEWSEERGKE